MMIDAPLIGVPLSSRTEPPMVAVVSWANRLFKELINTIRANRVERNIRVEFVQRKIANVIEE